MKNGQRARAEGRSSDPRVSPLLFGLLLAVILGVAALLRFHRLDTQSFWNDEGNSARIAERPLRLIVEGAAGDIHPPGYYLLLHGWRALFGHSEFALRSLSVVSGLALVAFTGLLGQRLFGRGVGLVAAALAALSPFGVYYSQEARMYALLGALSAASTYAALGLIQHLREPPEEDDVVSLILSLAAYSGINAVGLYSHYSFLFVLLAHNVVFGLFWLARAVRSGANRRSLGAWGTAQLGAALLFAPWLPAAARAAGWSSAEAAVQPGLALLDVARVLTVGVTQSLGAARTVLAANLMLFVVGLWPRPKERTAWRGWERVVTPLVYLVVPLGLFFVLDLYKSAWLKFLIVLLPAYHVLLGHGIANVAALVSGDQGLGPLRPSAAQATVCGVLVLAVGGLMAPSLRNLYFDPAYARDDYRQLAADLAEMRRPGDAIVLNAPNQWEVFTYYHPDRNVYPAPYRPRPGRAASFLVPLLDEYGRLFVLYWGDAESDPHKRIESYLAEHAYKASDRWYGAVRLTTYAVAPLPDEPQTLRDAGFGDSILLRGHALVRHAFEPGEIIPVTLFWEAVLPVEEPYKVSVQMLDGEGRLVSQVDTVPRDGLSPTTAWTPGAELVDRYGVAVPDEGDAGPYTLIVAVYRSPNGGRLPVRVDGQKAGDHLSLEQVTVGPEGE